MTSTRSLDEDFSLETDDYSAEATYGTNSETTSISSSIYAGYVENGRRYNVKGEGNYWGPSDEKQFESMATGHIVHYILDSEQLNPLFHSPLASTAKNILDIGSGTGDWARDVADRFSNVQVHGIDLFPTPDTWVPPNCSFEVDDVVKPWTLKAKMDLVHMRYMMGAFTEERWKFVYKQAYENIAPGGWIEQIEPTVSIRCDDGSLPADALLNGWGPMFVQISAKTGKSLDTEETFRSRIEEAGFENIHEKVYQVPIGEWAKKPLLKEAGKFEKMQILSGMEGYAMFLLTNYGMPVPWSAEEVLTYLAKIREELVNPAHHTYLRMRRVWAQKALDA